MVAYGITVTNVLRPDHPCSEELPDCRPGLTTSTIGSRLSCPYDRRNVHGVLQCINMLRYPRCVDTTAIYSLTRQLIDIESISGNEAAVGEFLLARLRELGFRADKMPVEDTRFNICADIGKPAVVVFSTHIDTVPPFIPCSEDDKNIYGRGASDTKGIIASMIAAALRLKDEGAPIGMLFVVGEERDSLGARVA